MCVGIIDMVCVCLKAGRFMSSFIPAQQLSVIPQTGDILKTSLENPNANQFSLRGLSCGVLNT